MMPEIGPLVDDGWEVYGTGTVLVAYHGATDKARVWAEFEGDAAPTGPRMRDAAKFLDMATLWLAESRARAHPGDAVIQTGLNLARERVWRDI